MSMTCMKLFLFCTIVLGFLSFSLFLISLTTESTTSNQEIVKWNRGIVSSEEKEQESRLLRVKQGCRSFLTRNLEDLISSRLDHFILDEAHKLIYCYVPKVACTNWKRVLLALRSQSSSHDPLTFKSNETHVHNIFLTLDQLSKEQALQKLRTHTKFVFVRNPYERLLSAYRNKFERSYSNYFLQRFGRKIVKLYRHNASLESINKGHITFLEFLKYVSDLSLAKDKSEFNEHWRPIVDLCYPCNVDFDVIGKYETLISDAEYTLKIIGISNFVGFPRRNQTYNMQPSSQLLDKYYKEIPSSILTKLAEIYEGDLKLFAYELDTIKSF